MKKVLDTGYLEQLGLKGTKEGGVSVKMKFGIKKGCLTSKL